MSTPQLELLRGLRLGRCARRLLLLSPLPDDEPQVIPPERDGRAAEESHRRAMRRLAEAGLVELSTTLEQIETRREALNGPLRWNEADGTYQESETRRVPVRQTVEKRTVKLTPLGAVVVDRLRPILETGRRIRWDSIFEPSVNRYESN